MLLPAQADLNLQNLTLKIDFMAEVSQEKF